MTQILTYEPALLVELLRLHEECLPGRWSAREVAGTMESPGVRALLSWDGEVFTGFVIYRVAADEAEIINVGVRESYRRKGIGELLVSAMLSDLEARDIEKFFLEVAEDNVAAIRLYEKTGFEKAGVRKGYYAGKDAWIMNKSLVAGR